MMAREMLTVTSRFGMEKLSEASSPLLGSNGMEVCLAPLDRSARLNKVRLTNGDNGQFRPQKRTGGHRAMDKITRMFVKAREYQAGQTMAEYALILAAVAVVVFVGYQTMGTTITTLLGSVDGKL